MMTATKSAKKTFALIGAGVGLSVFLAVALLPTLLYGGYAGLLLAGAITGVPVGASVAVKGLVVSGMVLAVVAVAALFALAGAAFGLAVDALTRRGERKAGASRGA